MTPERKKEIGKRLENSRSVLESSKMARYRLCNMYAACSFVGRTQLRIGAGPRKTSSCISCQLLEGRATGGSNLLQTSLSLLQQKGGRHRERKREMVSLHRKIIFKFATFSKERKKETTIFVIVIKIMDRSNDR